MFYKTLRVILDIPVITKVLVVILAFFAPLKDVIPALLAFLILDAITSIYWQYKCNLVKTNGERKFLILCATIESSKLRRTLEKMLFYVLALMVFYIFDRVFLKIVPSLQNALNTFSITNIAAILIGLVEITSIASNISKITNNPIFNKIIQLTQKQIDNATGGQGYSQSGDSGA